jgi:hypothetical protein
MGLASRVRDSTSVASDLALSSWLWKDKVLAGVAAPEYKGVDVPELLVDMEALLEHEFVGRGTTKPCVAKPRSMA